MSASYGFIYSLYERRFVSADKHTPILVDMEIVNKKHVCTAKSNGSNLMRDNRLKQV